MHTVNGPHNMREKDCLSTRVIRSGRVTCCTNRHNVLRDPEIESSQAQDVDSILVIPFAVQRTPSETAATPQQQQHNGHMVIVRADGDSSGFSANKLVFGVVVFCRVRDTFAPEQIVALEQIVARVSPGLHRWWSSQIRDMLRPPAQVKADTLSHIHNIQRLVDEKGWEALADAALQSAITGLLELKTVRVLIVAPDDTLYDIRNRGTSIQVQASSTRNLLISSIVAHGRLGSQSEPWLDYHKSHLEAEVVLHALVLPWAARLTSEGGKQVRGVVLGMTERELRNQDLAIAVQLCDILQTALRPSVVEEIDILQGELAAQQKDLARCRQDMTESAIASRFVANLQSIQSIDELAVQLNKSLVDLIPGCTGCTLAVTVRGWTAMLQVCNRAFYSRVATCVKTGPAVCPLLQLAR